MIEEPAQQTEQVLRFLRKEGNMAITPSDTRCAAKVGKKSRCKKEVYFDGFTWLLWCEDHFDKDEDARKTGKPRVELAE